MIGRRRYATTELVATSDPALKGWATGRCGYAAEDQPDCNGVAVDTLARPSLERLGYRQTRLRRRQSSDHTANQADSGFLLRRIDAAGIRFMRSRSVASGQSVELERGPAGQRVVAALRASPSE